MNFNFKETLEKIKENFKKHHKAWLLCLLGIVAILLFFKACI